MPAPNRVTKQENKKAMANETDVTRNCDCLNLRLI